MDFHAYTEHHLSLSDKGKRLDIWPKRLKYHNVKTNKRGVTGRDLIGFLDRWINSEPEPTKDELLSQYINNRFGTSLEPHHAAEIARYIINNY